MIICIGSAADRFAASAAYKRFAFGKTLMPGGFTPPEQVRGEGVPGNRRLMGNDALATVDDFVHERLGL